MTGCVRCLVTGRVQGVWYRAATQQQARSLGLRGYAKNLAGGGVEVVACGDHAAIEALRRWLWQGPPAAEVSAVTCAEVETADWSGFTTA